MSDRPRLREAVSWALPGHRPVGRGAAGFRFGLAMLPDVVLAVVDAALGGSGGGPALGGDGLTTSRRRLPRRPHDDVVVIAATGGTGSWARPSWADAPRVHVTSEGAWVERSARPRIELDLAATELVSLAGTRRSGQVAHPEDECAAVVRTRTGEVRLTGLWIELAWLGHLADWPDPATRPGAEAPASGRPGRRATAR